MNIKINKTYNYDAFKTLKINRVINKAMVSKLSGSIKRKNLMIDRPVLVDNQMRVLDGQHRIEACKLLNEPIYYCVAIETTLDDVPSLQIAKNWKSSDYMKMYIEQGNNNYKKLKLFMDQYNCPSINWALSLFNRINKFLTVSPEGNFRVDFKPAEDINYKCDTKSFSSGHYQYPDDDKIAHRKMTMIKEIGQYMPENESRSFYAAALIIVSDDLYEHNKMTEKLKNQSFRIKKATNSMGYLEQLEDVYNHKVKRANYIRFARAA